MLSTVQNTQRDSQNYVEKRSRRKAIEVSGAGVAEGVSKGKRAIKSVIKSLGENGY